MKKQLALLAIMVIFPFTSCNKESIDSSEIEGSWGIIHEEGWRKENGRIVDEYSYDSNPFNPSSDEDFKIDFINTDGDKYLISNYHWDPKTAKWKKEDSQIVTIKNGRISSEDSDESSTITIQSDRMTIEGRTKYIDDKSKVEVEVYGKMVLRKMSSLAE